MARILIVFATFLCIFQAVVERTFCFNYEPQLPVIKEGPRDSYFGFSVAEHRITDAEPVAPYDESVIIVGAPIHQTDINATKPGGVFRCPFSSNFSDCTLLPLDKKDEITNGDGTPMKSNQWLGVSVASQGPGGAVVACAHRYKVQPANIDEVQGLGKCYFLDNELEKDLFTMNGYVPCAGQTKPENYDGNLYKYCQAGTDVAVTKMSPDITIQEYIMGIPGTDNWLGGIATANVPGQALRNLVSPLDYLNSGVSFNSYLGFSVASAQLTDESDVQYYIAGAPRADAMGAVLVLKKDESLLRPSFFYRINAEKPSSSFGYDVAVADLNGDNFDDLIVGAPQYFDRQPQPTGVGGRVYIYENIAHDGTFDVEPIKLTGKRDSLFGQAVANIGDINLDGMQDIAIGAPYENDGEGAVYIYLGSADMVILQPEAQKITPSDLPMGLNGYPFPNATFGYSISGGVDLDGNGFPELTVGAYDVEQIVILRAKPVILIEDENYISHNELDPHTTNCEYSGKPAHCFTLEICMRYYSSSEALNDEITVEYDVEAELVRRDLGLNSRVVFEESSSARLMDQTLILPPQLSEDVECSPPISVIVKNGFQDIFRPIPLKVTYRIQEMTPVLPEPGDPLPSMSPFAMLDVSVTPEFNFEVVFTKECAQDDDVCITDLVVEASVSLQGDPPTLKVGEVTAFTLDVSVENRNEDAYDAQLIITYPVFLQFSDFVEQSVFTSRCQVEENEEGANVTNRICSLGNPYGSGSLDAFAIIFDAGSVPADAEEFNITLIVSSTTDMEENPADNVQVIKIEVESITDIIISGDGPEQMYFSGKVKGESAMVYFGDIGLPVNQEWTIFNKGPGAVNTALVTIHYPVEVENGKWLLYLTEMPYVENDRGVCNVTPAYYVNELGLKSKNSGVTYSPLPRTQSALSRKRRDVAPEAAKSTQELTSGKDITLDCASGTAKCIPITCDLKPLTKEQGEAKIIIRARLWNATFLEDYINARSVRIVTNGSVVIESAPYITQRRTDNDKAKQVTTVIPDIKTLPPSQPLSWWVIALAVVGGLLLLILLILLLWKCGFFKRKTGYKYATVTQQQTTVKAKKDKAGYYDDSYY
ncbi:integrin alpha-7-like [Diadema setosum]|uniref:integrin alpha-7-like n=1 Tax=Diadema setosum TaxID=31175 RepID=UPI003B3B75FF